MTRIWSDGMDPALTFQNGLCMGQDGDEPSQRRAREDPRVEIKTLGIDLAKNLFRIHGVDAEGRTTLERQLRRQQQLRFVAQLQPCLVGMEACGGAHYWAREIAKLGHQVRLMSPRFVRPYVKSNKNDAKDAEAICEAVARPSMRFVAVKSQAQQDVLALHRVRSLLIRERTALMNQMRGLLAECGIVVAQGAAHLRRTLAEILGSRDNQVSELLREALVEMSERLRSFEERLGRYDRQIGTLARSDRRAGQLMTVPGVGPLIATALIATVGDARQFKSGRELSAWLGLVPREHSSGERTILLGISKRGDRYLRTLLIHGARSALRSASHKRDRRSLWIGTLRDRRGPNIAAVALANKNARVLWALLTRTEEYRAPAAA
jgi:transposase